MSLDLILKDISDPIIRENFFRIQRYMALQSILTPEFKYFEIDVVQGKKMPVKHGLSFVPKDIIVTAILGDQNVFFNYMDFDRTNLYVTAAGPATVRFFAGAQVMTARKQAPKEKDFVAPGIEVDGGTALG